MALKMVAGVSLCIFLASLFDGFASQCQDGRMTGSMPSVTEDR